jgi:hypothetical protein
MENAIKNAISYLRRWQDMVAKELETKIDQRKRIFEGEIPIWIISFWRNPLWWLRQHWMLRKSERLSVKIVKRTAEIIEWASAENSLRQGKVGPAIQVFNKMLDKIPPNIYDDISLNFETGTMPNPVYRYISELRNSLIPLQKVKP